MRTDFNASSVAPWGARARGPAARCRSCGSTLNRWVMAGFPSKEWELDCCRGGRSGAVLKGAGAIGRVDVVLPRGWDAEELRSETLKLEPIGKERRWEALPSSQHGSAGLVVGLEDEGPAKTAPSAAAEETVEKKHAPPAVAEPEAESQEEEPFPLLPYTPFAKG